MNETTTFDWTRGDRGGLVFPAHPDALKAAGADFLTRAFRASGALGQDNSVTAITRLDEWVVGGAGTRSRSDLESGAGCQGRIIQDGLAMLWSCIFASILTLRLPPRGRVFFLRS